MSLFGKSQNTCRLTHQITCTLQALSQRDSSRNRERWVLQNTVSFGDGNCTERCVTNQIHEDRYSVPASLYTCLPMPFIQFISDEAINDSFTQT